MDSADGMDQLRATVRSEFPELTEIEDDDLRRKVVEAWAMALAESGLQRVGDVQGSGGPDYLVLKTGTQVDHLRGVALLSMRIADQLCQLQPDLDVDRDVLVAGALVHDVGKPMEYDPENRRRWAENPGLQGQPAARHSVHGWHICMSVGLPMEVAHIAIAHSKEGAFIRRSLECTIVHYADHAYWESLKAGGLLDEAYDM
jgi:putative nucleotidyltransferase with HDIG domain